MTGNRRRSLWAVFCWPMVMAAIGIVGLLSALLGDGLADFVSWLLLGSLPVVMCVAWRRDPRA
jgi:hypothetical protein